MFAHAPYKFHPATQSPPSGACVAASPSTTGTTRALAPASSSSSSSFSAATTTVPALPTPPPSPKSILVRPERRLSALLDGRNHSVREKKHVGWGVVNERYLIDGCLVVVQEPVRDRAERTAKKAGRPKILPVDSRLKEAEGRELVRARSPSGNLRETGREVSEGLVGSGDYRHTLPRRSWEQSRGAGGGYTSSRHLARRVPEGAQRASQVDGYAHRPGQYSRDYVGPGRSEYWLSSSYPPRTSSRYFRYPPVDIHQPPKH